MKTINNRTAKEEMGFTLDFIPKWHNYLFRYGDSMWFSFSSNKESYVLLDLEDLIVEYHENPEEFLLIPNKYAPKKGFEEYELGVYKIERADLYNYDTKLTIEFRRDLSELLHHYDAVLESESLIEVEIMGYRASLGLEVSGRIHQER